MFTTALLALICLFSGYGCYYFSTLRPSRPATITMALITAFSFWEAGFLCLARFAVGVNDLERLVYLLRSPLVVAPGVVGVMGTGLLLILIVRREVRASE